MTNLPGIHTGCDICHTSKRSMGDRTNFIEFQLNFNFLFIHHIASLSLILLFYVSQPRHVFGESPTGSNPNQMRLSVIDVVSSCSNHASHFQITEVTGRCHVPQVSRPLIESAAMIKILSMKYYEISLEMISNSYPSPEGL